MAFQDTVDRDALETLIPVPAPEARHKGDAHHKGKHFGYYHRIPDSRRPEDGRKDEDAAHLEDYGP